MNFLHPSFFAEVLVFCIQCLEAQHCKIFGHRVISTFPVSSVRQGARAMKEVMQGAQYKLTFLDPQIPTDFFGP